MTRRTVSVVINNYNYARFLRQAIDSALAQSYPAEVVVVDDGSSDDSPEVIRSYGDKIRAVMKANGGQGSALNAGFAAARGDIIILLDSDDYLSPVAVERVVAAWKDDTAILYHRLRVVDAVGREIGVNPPARNSFEEGDMVPALLQNGSFCYPPTSGQVYSRVLLSQILPMPEPEWMLCADTYLAIAAAFRAKVSVADEIIAHYRVHDANTFGLPMTRATFTRAKLTTHTKFEEARHTLIRRIAAEHDLPAPTFPTAPIYFAKLQLGRADPTGYDQGKGMALYLTLLRRLWTERGTWRHALQKSVVGLLLAFGPGFLLRKMYPKFFDAKSV